MSDLSIEDFKNVLLDLYLSQRANADLSAQLAFMQNDVSGEHVKEEVTSYERSGDRRP